ncbi:MAG: AmmeMemoRadiSam system radical SAM enzyme [Chloroflexi bacterium]|nr:AmmeMemoRadiSam system radical SAM enzyme [Chloroflexota bacterium]
MPAEPHEARFYEPLGADKVRCSACAHRCVIRPGARGICQVRENQAGTLYSLVYGQAVAATADPIEKKPLFHFMPGSRTFSIATRGCNLSCVFCQNADISQVSSRSHLEGERSIAPILLVRSALAQGCASMAYTYTEPTIFVEYAADIAALAVQHSLANVWVSNGFMTPEVIAALTSTPRMLDAANIDLKAFSDTFYRRHCGARLQPVLDALKALKNAGVWLEVTTLLIPNANDTEAELRALAEFIAAELGANTPWHISRFHPTYRMQDRPSTPAASLMRAAEIGREAGLHYVYLGNLPGNDGENTLCPRCGEVVIRRRGFDLLAMHKSGACASCGQVIAGVGL